ncbi:MAG: response regulator, partial [Proteobacteria bacterium]|nr:response regulator [Pseudomonadota bacterium]
MTPVLMIDDDEGLAAPLKDYFARYDLALDHAAEPLAGIEKLKQGRYAFLVLDIMLPGIDGFEVCRRVRKFSDIPVIMLTARG